MTRRAAAAWAAGALALVACSADPVVSEPTPRATSTAATDATTAPPDIVEADTTGSSEASVATAPGETDVATAVLPEGFTTAVVEITEADGTVCEVCVWLADTPEERGRGLMGVTSLGAALAMAFVWDEPTAGAFFMFQTVTPLSIAWFATDGALVSTADMEPCLDTNSADCERFAPGGDYVLAIEVFQGDLEAMGITSGARARLLPGTEAVDCPLA